MAEQCSVKFNCVGCRCILDLGHVEPHDQHCGQPTYEGLIINPGDHILVRYDSDTQLSMEEFEAIKRTLQDRFPACGVTIITADQIAAVRNG